MTAQTSKVVEQNVATDIVVVVLFAGVMNAFRFSGTPLPNSPPPHPLFTSQLVINQPQPNVQPLLPASCFVPPHPQMMWTSLSNNPGFMMQPPPPPPHMLRPYSTNAIPPPTSYSLSAAPPLQSCSEVPSDVLYVGAAASADAQILPLMPAAPNTNFHPSRRALKSKSSSPDSEITSGSNVDKMKSSSGNDKGNSAKTGGKQLAAKDIKCGGGNLAPSLVPKTRVSSASTLAPVISPPASCQTMLATSDSQPTSATTSCTSDLTNKSSASSLQNLSVMAPLFLPSTSSYSLAPAASKSGGATSAALVGLDPQSEACQETAGIAESPPKDGILQSQSLSRRLAATSYLTASSTSYSLPQSLVTTSNRPWLSGIGRGRKLPHVATPEVGANTSQPGREGLYCCVLL